MKAKDLFKIFGPDPKRALKLMEEGLDKQEIYEKTGLTVGVRDAGFTVHGGEVFVVMGLSGSGKSTLVRMLNRPIEPTAGDVLVDGQNVTKMSMDELVKFRLHNMSMVFQSFALMPHLSVLDNAAFFGLELAKVDKERREKRAMEALEQAGLKGWENSYPAEAFVRRGHFAPGGHQRAEHSHERRGKIPEGHRAPRGRVDRRKPGHLERLAGGGPQGGQVGPKKPCVDRS